MRRTALALLLALAALPAAAQTGNRTCADRDSVLDRLSGSYGETRQSIGLGQNNAVIEVFASAETGTWTITVTLPSGLTCLVASGQAFEHLNETLQPASEDT
ncbi:hypothetical protein [Anianabacter salinae]|uniref:hypothetical protein n=1 Tax=Anianabacter salinae TaxID=2851023 RepID=UPI00225E3640|nr:hypothetical protein [Anianabacter salinae]MBV0913022.1 hypothetical protein [Anianabacter salinae]